MQRKLNIQGNKQMCWHPGCLVHELRIVQLNWGKSVYQNVDLIKNRPSY